jgi:hypothetical protein
MNMSTVLLLRLPVKARTAVLPPAGQRTARPWLIGSGHSAEQAEEWVAQLPAWTGTDRQVLDDFASKNATKWAARSRQRTERRVRDLALWTGEWADHQTDGHQSAPSLSAGRPHDVGAGAALPPRWKLADTGCLMTRTYRVDSDTSPPSPYTARLQTSGDDVTAIVLDLEGQVAASGRLTTADAFGIVDQVETPGTGGDERPDGRQLPHLLAQRDHPAEPRAPDLRHLRDVRSPLHRSWPRAKRLDRLHSRDMQTWINQVARTCQCCEQGKDAARPKEKRRCCAIGRCCQAVPSTRTVSDIRAALRAALTHAQSEDLITKNPAVAVTLATVRRRRGKSWSSDEARKFLESARADEDPLYAAYALVLVTGLRKGEALGLTWEDVGLDAGELTIGRQLQRVRGQLLHRDTKTQASDATLPCPASA